MENDFKMVKDVELGQPLTSEILSNSDHQFVKTLIYIYSMQSFIFGEMNKASRTKNINEIKYYGPFASALSFIISSKNNQDGPEMNTEFVVYRGL